MSTTPTPPADTATPQTAPASSRRLVRAARFARRRPILAAGIGLASAVAVAAASIGVGAAVATVQHAQADDAYQTWRVALAKDNAAAVKETARFDGARAPVAELAVQLQQAWDTSDGFFTAEQREALDRTRADVAIRLEKEKAGQVRSPRSVATKDSTTDELRAIASSLQAQHKEAAAELPTTRKATKNLQKLHAEISDAIAALIGVVKADEAAPPGAGLQAAADVVLATWTLATPESREALGTAALSAQRAAASGKGLGQLLLDYVAAAATVKTSHEAAAAEAQRIQEAQNSGAETYIDPTTNETKRTPSAGANPGTGGVPGNTGGDATPNPGAGAQPGAGTSGNTPAEPTQPAVTPGLVTFSGANYSGCAAGARIDGGYFTNDPSPKVIGSYGVPWTGSSWIEGQRSYYAIYQCSGGGAGGW